MRHGAGTGLPVPALLLYAAVAGLAGCSDACVNDEIASSVSPDGRHRAVMFQRDCGTTTGFSTQISVLERDAPLTGSGNAFIADDDHGAATTGEWGGPWAELRWQTGDRLMVRYARGARIFEQRVSVGTVSVSYEAADTAR